MARLTLEHLVKTFPGGTQAVSDLSLDLADGELLVLVGPSGCGKTTTLRLIAGLERPDAGTVSIGGRAVDHLPPKDRNLAMVFQGDALYPQMTVFQNMAFGMKMRRVPRPQINARVREAAKLLQIGDLLDRRPGTLSGGQCRRVAIGRAIVRKPDVFLLDEPLCGLDARLREQMRVEIAALHRRLRATILYVTHDQLEAMTLGDRVAVVQRGVLQQVSTPSTLYHEPINRFVAGFLGSPPMNFLSGRIARVGGSTTFLSDGGAGLPIPPARAGLPWVRAYLDRPVTLGIRPEHVGSEAAAAAELPAVHPARVATVETQGFESYVHFVTSTARLVGRTADPNSFEQGQRINVPLDMERALFFDLTSGRRIA